MLLSKINYFLDNNNFLFTYKNNQLYIEDFDKIISVSTNAIKLKSDQLITITGRNLLIKKITAQAILVTGSIDKIDIR